MTVFYDPRAGGFFDSGIHAEIPDGAVEVARDVYRALLDAQADGMQIVAHPDGYPIAVDPPRPVLPVPMLLAQIDAAAGVARSRYITVAPGQEATYLLKAQQAAAYKAGGYAGDVPGLVQAEVDATGATPRQAADAILAQQAAWEVVAARIESARRRGKLAVAAAADSADAEVRRDTAIAELDRL